MTKATRRQHTEELKRETVKLVVEEGRKVGEVARNLGIDRSMLDRWRQPVLAPGGRLGQRPKHRRVELVAYALRMPR